MYYGLGTKEDIFTDLYTQIAAITDIGKVDWQRGVKLGVKLSEYPGVFINFLRIEKQKMLKDLFKNILTVMLVCFVKAGPSEDLGTELNTFINSVETAVLSDPYRDSNAYDTEIQTIALEDGSRHPLGMFIMELVIPFYSST